MKKRLFSALLSSLIVCVADAQTPEDIFRQANEHYRGGGYQEAAKQYESIVARGIVSAPLYFNLGNSYYRMGAIAEAVLAYERSLRLDPGDEDIAFNLKLAQMRTVDRIEAVPELFLVSWMKAAAGILPLETAAGLFFGGWSVVFLSLATLYLLVRGSFGRILRWLILASLLLTTISGAVLALQVSRLGEEDSAVIMAPVVTAKTSPDAQSLDAFVVHAGLTVRVDDVVGEWTKIILADGKIGWVRSETFEPI